MNVLPVLDAVLARLREKLPQLQVEYFPEKPAEYRLNHPVGALLLSYAGSRFDRPDDTGAVIQSQTIQLCVTVVFRQLNGKKGAINVLDAVRRILGGHTPPHGPSPAIRGSPGHAQSHTSPADHPALRRQSPPSPHQHDAGYRPG